ncbi:hypothetical protein RchiOBHm_Chr7g0222721 [Rosa chinensis]|uniref:Uncharacterized protein n=1 Tax=Rosa chinensis TaxID=74649 RepID=A0A2P6PDD1_ROSCH|nr:hypothetical protein RchiOBHm_Chr7g0222721 [Rosa chinensis]
MPKKLKVPEFHTKFSAKSLGLIEALGGVLIPKEGSFPKETMQLVKVEQKKKRGRPLGSKNKNSSKNMKIAAEEVLSMLCPGKPPSPSVKGKEKI